METSKNFPEQDAVENYIQEIVELKIPVKALINKNVVLFDCRLIYEAGDRKRLLIRTKPGDHPETGEAALECVYSNTLYTFKSRIISRKEVDTQYTYLEIQFPDKIAKEERRKHLRIRPSEENPIHIRFSLADNSVVSIEAMDISGGGLSIVVPSKISQFQIGDSFSLNIALPKFGEVHSSGAIKVIAPLLNMIRVGIEFLDMNERDYSTIIQYVMAREIEIRKESEKLAPLKRPKIYLIDHSQQHQSYQFLDSIFNVIKTDFFNVIPRLAESRPDLITLNKDLHESRMLLQLIKKHRVLKDIPLILLSREEKEEDNIHENAAILNIPFNENLFVKTAEGFIDKYRFSKKHSEKKIKMLSGKPKKALIIDRFGNFSAENTEILTKHGFQVTTSSNEGNIMKKIESDYPDIILFDEETEKVDPVSICRLININKTIKVIPKIILTSDEKNFDNFYSQGLFAGFLIKPFNSNQLISKVFDTLLQRAGS